MKIYNQLKTEIIENPNLELGYLQPDKRLVKTVPEQHEAKEQFHYQTVKEFSNGGKQVKKVIDVPYSPYIPEHEEYEDIQVYIPYTAEELLDKKKQALRQWREKYFEIIDRAAWYDSLTSEQKMQVQTFRRQLLDITDTLAYPTVPDFIEKHA